MNRTSDGGRESVFYSTSFLGSGPEGADDLCFHTWGNFSFSSFFFSSFSSVPPPRLKPQSPNSSPEVHFPITLLGPLDPNPSLKAQIPSPKPKFKAQGPNLSLNLQIPMLRLKSQSQGSNPSLEAQVPVLRLKS